MTITWSVVTLDRELSDGGVFLVHWDVIALSDTEVVSSIGDPDVNPLSVRRYGAVGVTADPSSPDFIAYEDLTEADCLGWVWQQVDKDEIEQQVTAELEALEDPTTGEGTPWGASA